MCPAPQLSVNWQPWLRRGGDQPRPAVRPGGQGRRRPGGSGPAAAPGRDGAAADADRPPGASRARCHDGAGRPVLPAAAGAAGGRRTGHRTPGGFPGQFDGRTGRPAAAAGPAGRRRRHPDRGTRGVLLVLPQPGRRGRAGVPAGWPASRPRPGPSWPRRTHRWHRRRGHPAAGPAGPRLPDPAHRPGPVWDARPAARLRGQPGRRGGRPGRMPGGDHPPVRLLPVHRRCRGEPPCTQPNVTGCRPSHGLPPPACGQPIPSPHGPGWTPNGPP